MMKWAKWAMNVLLPVLTLAFVFVVGVGYGSNAGRGECIDAMFQLAEGLRLAAQGGEQ